MPMAFGSLLGGLTTLIGTPPNIIISSFRARDGGEAFGMFDFTPVGVAVAVAGVLFISLFGWRLIPRRKAPASREELFHVQDYFTEVLVPEGSKLVGTTIRDLEEAEDVELRVLGLVRNGRRLLATSGYEVVRPEDILMVRIDSDQMANLVDSFGLKMVGSEEAGESSLSSEDASLMEVVIMPDSLMVGKTVRVLNLRTLYSINLLAVARQGTQLRARLSNIRLQTGDVLLLHGRTEVLQEQLPLLGCLPLAERGFRLGQPRRLLLALAIFGGV
jgi:di/tricarboxylate transporter